MRLRTLPTSRFTVKSCSHSIYIYILLTRSDCEIPCTGAAAIKRAISHEKPTTRFQLFSPTHVDRMVLYLKRVVIKIINFILIIINSNRISTLPLLTGVNDFDGGWGIYYRHQYSQFRYDERNS